MDTVRIDLQPIVTSTIWVEIVGDTELIVHAFSEKAQIEIQQRQGAETKTTKKKTIRKPEEEFEAARHRFVNEDGELVDGYAATGIKACMMDAGMRYLGLVKEDLKRDLHINQKFVEIISDPPEMREDMVRLGGVNSPADVRYRPGYWPWSMVIPITYRPDRISAQQIVAMLAHGGFSCGLGEWRPASKRGVGGDHGRFHVGTVQGD